MNRLSDRVAVLDQGRLFIAREFKELFDYNGISNLRAIEKHKGNGIVKKVLEERYTLRMELKNPTGREYLFYIKKYFLKAGKKPGPLAQAEWMAMWWFQEENIPGPEPVALGMDWDEAFVISKAVPHVMKLDQWARTYLEDRQNTGKDSKLDPSMLKRQIIDSTADIIGRLHWAGMCHQDLYLCHFLCGSRDKALPLTLIDVQRVRKFNRGLPLRWQVKDLAQFYFSAGPFVQKTDINRFWHTYSHVNQGNRIPSLLLMPLIRFKANRIRRHTVKHGL